MFDIFAREIHHISSAIYQFMEIVMLVYIIPLVVEVYPYKHPLNLRQFLFY